MVSKEFTEFTRRLESRRTLSQAQPLPSLEESRAFMDTMGDWGHLPDGVTIEPVRGLVDGIRITPQDAVPGSAVLYLHGGGYFSGSSTSHQNLGSHVAVQSRRVVLLIDYRLAPEHKFPAQLEDALAGYDVLLAAGFREIFLVGDSAGGGLALTTAMAVRDTDRRPAAGVVMMSPWLDLSCALMPSDAVDVVVRAASLAKNADLLLDRQSAASSLASPLYRDLAGLPPLYLQVGDQEVLYHEALHLSERAREAGQPCRIDVLTGRFHVFQLCVGALPEADGAVSEIGSWIQMESAQI